MTASVIAEQCEKPETNIMFKGLKTTKKDAIDVWAVSNFFSHDPDEVLRTTLKPFSQST